MYVWNGGIYGHNGKLENPIAYLKDMQPEAELLQYYDYKDIKQGYLGDCYLLAALSSIVRFEELRKDLLVYDKFTDS